MLLTKSPVKIGEYAGLWPYLQNSKLLTINLQE